MSADAGRDAALVGLAAARLAHDAVDARAMEELREEQAGRAGADDGDLGSQGALGGGWRRTRATGTKRSSGQRAP